MELKDFKKHVGTIYLDRTTENCIPVKALNNVDLLNLLQGDKESSDITAMSDKVLDYDNEENYQNNDDYHWIIEYNTKNYYHIRKEFLYLRDAINYISKLNEKDVDTNK